MNTTIRDIGEIYFNNDYQVKTSVRILEPTTGTSVLNENSTGQKCDFRIMEYPSINVEDHG